MIPDNKILERWLLLVASGHIVAGVAIPVLAYSSAFDLYSALLKAAFWPTHEVPLETIEFQRWFAALFGPTIASVGVVLVYLVKAGIKYREAWPWNALLIGIAFWAPGDIYISLMRNFWLHVEIDVVAVLAIVPPALLLRVRAIGYQKQI